MTGTPTEATKKWCPFRREPDEYFRDFPAVTNRETYCMGNKCMCWEWISIKEQIGYCGLSHRR